MHCMVTGTFGTGLYEHGLLYIWLYTCRYFKSLVFCILCAPFTWILLDVMNQLKFCFQKRKTKGKKEKGSALLDADMKTTMKGLNIH